MKQLLLLTFVFALVPSISHGQSDLKKIGNILQGIQDMQQRQNRPSPGPPGEADNTRPMPYRVNPNESGNQNQGGFNGRDFFNPQGQPYPQQGQPYPQQRQPYPQQGQIYPQQGQPYPNNGMQPYPNQNIVYPNQSPPVRKVYSNQPIKILCDPNAIGTCSYELITAKNTVFPYSINGGQSQNLTENTDWALRYRPTPSSPYKTYRLRGGKTYELRKAGNMWQCYMLQ